LKEAGHKFYGAVTVGERGQVVIPQEARGELNINPGDKLLIFSGITKGRALIVMKAEDVTEYVAAAMDRLSNFEKMVKKAQLPGREEEVDKFK